MRSGPVVRVAPNTLSFSNPAVLRDIYSSKSFVKEKTFYVSGSIAHINVSTDGSIIASEKDIQ